MIKRLKNTFLLYKTEMYQILAVMGGVWVLGMLITTLVINFSREPINEYVNLAFVFSMTIGALTILLTDFMFFAINFNIAVSMGVTRKHFIFNTAIVLLIQHIIYIAFLFVINRLELALVKLFMPGIDLSKEPPLVIDGTALVIMLGAAVAFIAVGLLIGSLLQRFGKIAFWIMWGIYMFVAFGGMGIVNLAETKSGFVGAALTNVINAVNNISAGGMLTIAAVLCTILAGVGVLVFRKAPVK